MVPSGIEFVLIPSRDIKFRPVSARSAFPDPRCGVPRKAIRRVHLAIDWSAVRRKYLLLIAPVERNQY